MLKLASRERSGNFLRCPQIEHVFSPGPSLSRYLQQTADIASGCKHAGVDSLDLGERVWQRQLISSTQESALRDDVRSECKAFKVRGRALEDWLDALSEAVTNALYNAPRVGSEAPFLEIDRRREVVLPVDRAVTVSLFQTPMYDAFEVRDSFGSLAVEHMRSFIGGALTRDGARAIDKPGGAGLGLLMMFDRLERLVVFVTPGVETSVVGVAPKSYGKGHVPGHTVQFFRSSP